jgi:hypothetical protein
MPLDGTILGNLAAEQMAALERDYGDMDGAQIGAVMTIVEVLTPQGADEGGNQMFGSTVRSRHNIGDPYRAIGVIKAAEHNITETAFGKTTSGD